MKSVRLKQQAGAVTLFALISLASTLASTQPAAAAPASFQMPFPCGETWLATTYGGHQPSEYSIDWNLPTQDLGRPVQAGLHGTATAHYGSTGYGNYVEINAGAGWTVRYAHLQTITINNGAVSPQTQVGTVGSTGNSTAPHLHYEQRFNGVVQPATFNGVPVSYAYSPPGHAYTSANCSSSSGRGTLYFIKTKNTGSGRVEVHSATPESGYRSGVSSASRFSTGEDPNGWFQMAGSTLYFIKTKNSGSGRVEVHNVTAASGYQSGSGYASAFSPADADNGWFQMADVNFDGVQDLVFIKTRNVGSGRVEFFVADGSRGYGVVTSANATAFSPADASNGWFQAQGRDLVFIKTRNTGTGRVEYFRATAASGYSAVTVATGTAFSPADQNNGWFSSEDVNGDGIADLIFAKTHNPGSGRVELFVADGSRSYQQITSANVTRFSPADASNGWWLVDSKQ